MGVSEVYMCIHMNAFTECSRLINHILSLYIPHCVQVTCVKLYIYIHLCVRTYVSMLCCTLCMIRQSSWCR